MKTKIMWDAFSKFDGRYVGTIEGKDKKEAMREVKTIYPRAVTLSKVQFCPTCNRRLDIK